MRTGNLFYVALQKNPRKLQCKHVYSILYSKISLRDAYFLLRRWADL